MRRRKFILGMGAVAAGGTAALSTGAFTSVNANRDVSVGIANDNAAYLGLESASQYSSHSGEANTLSMNFDQLNWDATTTIYPVFRVENNGTRNVAVSIDHPGPSDKLELHWYVGEQGGKTLCEYDPVETFTPGEIENAGDNRVVPPGQKMPVGMFINTGDAAGERQSPFSDLENPITITARSAQEV